MFGKAEPIIEEIVEAVEIVARKIIEKAEMLFSKEASKINGIFVSRRRWQSYSASAPGKIVEHGCIA